MQRLSTCRFSRFTSVRRAGSIAHALALHLVQDGLPRLPQRRRHRVPREGVQERQQPVGDEVHRLHQEVATAHRGVEHRDIEQVVHTLANVNAVFSGHRPSAPSSGTPSAFHRLMIALFCASRSRGRSASHLASSTGPTVCWTMYFTM